jgi:hypothetical protein
MTGDQIFSLMDSFIKIGSGALAGAITTWLTAKYAFNIKKHEIDFEKNKICFERDQGLIKKAIQAIENNETIISEMINHKIEAIHYNGTERIDATKKVSDALMRLGQNFTEIASLLNMLGNEEIIECYSTLHSATIANSNQILALTTMEEMDIVHVGRSTAKNAVVGHLSRVYRQLI